MIHLVKNLPTMQETCVQSLGWEHPLEEGRATHSSILSWRIPWTEVPSGLPSMGSQRIKHNWATKHSTQSAVHAPSRSVFLAPTPSPQLLWILALKAILYGAIYPSAFFRPGIDHLIHMLLVISPAPSCSSHFLIGLSLNKPPDAKNWLIGKDPDAGKDWRQKAKGTTEDEMVGWHHWHDGHEFEQAPGVGDGQGGLACCDSWGLKELDTTEWLNWTELKSPACKSLSQTLFLGNLT